VHFPVTDTSDATAWALLFALPWFWACIGKIPSSPCLAESFVKSFCVVRLSVRQSVAALPP
jgi:hypothetical protein